MSDSTSALSDLSPRQRELLLLRLSAAGKRQAEAQTAKIKLVSRVGQPLPTSFTQQRLWFLDRLQPGAAYNIPFAVRLKGLLDVVVLEDVVNEIARRHDILRTTFTLVEDQPVQIIGPVERVALLFHDLSGLSEEERYSAFFRLMRESAQQSFDLTHGPLWRVGVLRMEEVDHVVLLTMHHIASDGWSMNILLNEMTVLYDAFLRGLPSPLKELPIQYADYAVLQRENLSGALLESKLSYWRKQLAGAPTVLELPTDRPRPPIQTFSGAREKVILNVEVVERFKLLCQQEGATLFMGFLAAFKALLYRYTAQEDIVIGTPIAGRNLQETEPLIGFFSNTLALRSRLEPEAGFRHLLAQVKEVCLGAYAHQELPFEKLVEELQPERNLSHSPIFQVMFALLNTKTAGGGNDNPGTLTLIGLDTDSGTSKFDLTLTLSEDQNWFGSELEYKTDLFDSSTIARLVTHYLRFLEGVVAQPDQPLYALPLLTEEEEHQLLHLWNDTRRPAPQHATLGQLFSTQALLTPEAVALVFAEQQLTYQQLEYRSNQAARYLVNAGVRPEHLVGVCLERSAELVVWLLAVIKAGGAYVPLDPSYPAARLQQMTEDSGLRLVITDERASASVGERVWGESEVVLIERLAEEVARLGGEELRVADEISGENLAYVIYTSGSTGRPKGVQIQHRAVTNLLAAMQEQLGLTSTDTLFAVTSLSFDIAGLELFLPLSVGARVVIASREVATDAPLLAAALSETSASVMQATPSTWRMLLESGWTGQPNLTILCGGEALRPDLAMQLVLRGASVWNLYGPTETTIWSSALRLQDDHALVTLGTPISNTRIHILDSHLQLTPIGVAGELFISGDGVARGYFKQPGLTAERFLPAAYSKESGGRMYRTGDLARYRADGALEYLGRLDQQIKLRGFRLELSEIEVVLEAHPDVAQAVVVARADERGDMQLVSYLVARAGAQLSMAAVRMFVRERLPQYMEPGQLVELEALPLTPNGKVDRKALPVVGPSREAAVQYVEARTPTEELLVGLWREVLRVEKVGVHDNFFRLGGHSLLATLLMSRVHKTFEREIRLSALFEYPTIAGLSELIETQLRQGSSFQSQPIKPASRSGELPLSYAQQRQWFLDQLEPGTSAYNMPSAVRVHGAFDLGALERAVTEAVRRHEVLRTVFVTLDDRPVQVIQPPFQVQVQVTDLSHLDAEPRESEAAILTAAEARQPFDLAHGLLLRVSVLRLAAEEHIVLLTMHHIVSDGWSMGVLVNELVTLYDAFTNERPSPLPELAIQYADYAAWQQSWLRGETLDQQLSYWKQQLQGAPVLELPTDRPRPPVQTFRGAREIIRLGTELSAELQVLSRREGVTLFMTLLASWHLLLSRYSGQDDISVGTFIANRNRAETEPLIGFFINNLVFRLDLSGNPTFREVLKRERTVALGAYAHQDVPFELVLEAIHPERDASRTRLFQVMFVMQNMPQAEVELTEVRFSPVESKDPGRSNFDLTLWMWEGPAGLAGWLDYSTDLFDAATIARLVQHYTILLEGIVAQPEQHLQQLPWLSEAERRQTLIEWNANRQDFSTDLLVFQIFEQQAARQPNAEAVVFQETRLTYGELNARANQLAHYLRAQGVGPETRVGICMERSVEMIVAVLGVLKSGGAYIPLDPSYPPARLLFMIEDSRASWLLTQRRLIESLPASTVQELSQQGDAARVLCLDTDLEVLAAQSTENPIRTAGPENLAYVIYTSGSTQRPRGVMIQHRSLVNAFAAWEKAYSLSSQIKCQLQVASFAFDVFSADVIRVFCSGGKLVIAPGEFLLSAPDLYDLMRREQVEGIEVVPAVLRNLAQYLEASGQTLDFIRAIVAGADAFYIKDMELVKRLSGPRTRVLNSYGLTEATIDSTYFESTDISLQPERMAPIGRPFANTKIYLLDSSLQTVPVGVAGELHVGGPSLARGYINHPELTATKFIPNPFSDEPGARLYKTGDLARYLPDGNIEFLRRMDYQVKVRGFRIELEEIESVLATHHGVREALVIAHQHQRGEKVLVAYLVPAQAEPPTVQELQQLIKQHLPSYMTPAAFIMLEAFPLTANGKVDRRGLPAPEPELLAAGDTYVAPSTPLEEMLVSIWEEVLGRQRVSIFDNFFEIGGHSLLATQMVARVNSRIDVELPVRSIFETPMIAELAVTIEEMMMEQLDSVSGN